MPTLFCLCCFLAVKEAATGIKGRLHQARYSPRTSRLLPLLSRRDFNGADGLFCFCHSRGCPVIPIATHFRYRRCRSSGQIRPAGLEAAAGLPAARASAQDHAGQYAGQAPAINSRSAQPGGIPRPGGRGECALVARRRSRCCWGGRLQRGWWGAWRR